MEDSLGQVAPCPIPHENRNTHRLVHNLDIQELAFCTHHPLHHMGIPPHNFLPHGVVGHATSPLGLEASWEVF